DAYEFSWAHSFQEYVEKNDKPFPDWNKVLSERPPLLQFWYRQSPYPLTAVEFHDDHLTPGLVTQDDPPFTQSGMIQVELDARGRLIHFEALPEQKLVPANWALAALFLVPWIGGPLLARRNLAQGRGDRRGALRLAVFVFFVQMAMWLCRSHFNASIGLLGMFILAVCTSVFYGVAGGV